eukprot:2615351-Pleurochrysis_carterae.AAC.3
MHLNAMRTLRLRCASGHVPIAAGARESAALHCRAKLQRARARLHLHGCVRARRQPPPNRRGERHLDVRELLRVDARRRLDVDAALLDEDLARALRQLQGGGGGHVRRQQTHRLVEQRRPEQVRVAAARGCARCGTRGGSQARGTWRPSKRSSRVHSVRVGYIAFEWGMQRWKGVYSVRAVIQRAHARHAVQCAARQT